MVCPSLGESSEPIPIHFAYRRDINIEAGLSAGAKLSVDRPLRDVFDTPDLGAMDDAIANGTLKLSPGAPEPLALFRAARVDYSLHRLYHYTGTDPEHFQNFVIFTNYQPLQCPPMHIEAARRLRHVASAGLVNLLDVLQAHIGRRHGMLWRLSFAAQWRQQRGDNVIRIHREIVDGAEFYCLDSSRDIAVARQNDRACIGSLLLKRRNDVLGRTRHRIACLPQHIPVRSAEFELSHRTPIRQSSP
jgi:hypothetical protein